MSNSRGLLVADATWVEIEQALAKGGVAVLPVGAASKEHGFHLPLGTDRIQADWLGKQIAAGMNAVVWPTVSYGYYPVFVDYPGSISLSHDTFVALVREILDGMIRSGARTITIVNTGISTIAPLRELLGGHSGGAALALINAYDGPAFLSAVTAIEEQAFGGHADEIETSIMLALAPNQVDMDRAVAQSTPILRGLFNRTDPQAPNYCPSGANGNPTLATREKGLRLVEAMRRDVLAAIHEARGAC